MAVDPVSVVVGLLLLFFLPGWLALHALFPGRRYFGPFHPFALPALSVVVSVAVLVVVGTVLGFLPGGPEGRGWFQGNKSFEGAGAPVLEIVLASLCAVLFALAWWRGGFPLLGRARPEERRSERGEPEDVTLLRDLRLEEERLRKEAGRIRKRADESRDVGVRTALREAAAQLEEERADLSKRAAQMERRAGERRYGQTAEQLDPRSRIRKP